MAEYDYRIRVLNVYLLFYGIDNEGLGIGCEQTNGRIIVLCTVI